jgi:translation initiation factor 3 subunit G
VVSEEIIMNFVHNKDESEKDASEDKSAIQRLAAENKGVVKCRICKEDHWTTMCPYKDTLGPLRDSLAGTETEGEGGIVAGGKIGEAGKPAGGPPGPAGPGGAVPAGGGGPGGKYVPPSRRGADGRVGESMPDRKGRGKDWYWNERKE